MESREQDYLAREARARIEIDRQLVTAGWVVQSQGRLDLSAGPGSPCASSPALAASWAPSSGKVRVGSLARVWPVRSDRSAPADNPILNLPYEQPDRYSEIGPQGPRGEMKNGRRLCESLIPIAVTKKGKDGKEKSEQEALDFDATGERREKNSLINDTRRDVAEWRRGGEYAGCIPIIRKLLQHWADVDRENRVIFAQREAAETVILKAALKSEVGAESRDTLYREALRYQQLAERRPIWQDLQESLDSNATRQMAHCHALAQSVPVVDGERPDEGAVLLVLLHLGDRSGLEQTQAYVAGLSANAAVFSTRDVFRRAAGPTRAMDAELRRGLELRCIGMSLSESAWRDMGLAVSNRSGGTDSADIA